MKARAKQAPGGVFRNVARIDQLHSAVLEGNRERLEEIINDRTTNSAVSKKLKAKGVTWETLLEDSVWSVQEPTTCEQVVVKLFVDFPFHEICGNVIATKLIDTAGPFFVRCFDVGRFTDTDANYFIIMEFIADDPESLDLGESIQMYNLFYQVAYATHHFSAACQLQHFDLRYDNIRVKLLPENKDFFRNGVKTNFLIKIGDWGQCEFNFGASRPVNEEIPRGDDQVEKWGIFPSNYSNYDFQYFLSTLTPTLDSLHGLSYYYIYNMILEFMQPVSFTSAQDRPVVITDKSSAHIVSYLKSKVLSSVTLLDDLDEGNKENEKEDS